MYKKECEKRKQLNKWFRELCDLQPVYHVYVNYGDLDSDYRLITNKRKYKLISDTRWNIDDEDNLKNLKADLYPDIFDASNIIKLMETSVLTQWGDPEGWGDDISDKYSTILGSLYWFGLSAQNREELIYNFCCLLRDGMYPDGEKVKESVRKIDFNYETAANFLIADQLGKNKNER